VQNVVIGGLERSIVFRGGHLMHHLSMPNVVAFHFFPPFASRDYLGKSIYVGSFVVVVCFF
jgi:hypothetical protein